MAHKNEQGRASGRATAEALVKKLQSSDAESRMAAAHAAQGAGPDAIPALARLMAGNDPDVAKAAKEALIVIVHRAARPGAPLEARAAAERLAAVAAHPGPRAVRADAIYLLGFVGGPASVPALARLLNDPDVGEEARMALQRIPGTEAAKALKEAHRRGR